MNTVGKPEIYIVGVSDKIANESTYKVHLGQCFELSCVMLKYTHCSL